MTTQKRRGQARGEKTSNGERMMNESDLTSMVSVAVMPEVGMETEDDAPYGGMGDQGYGMAFGGMSLGGGMGEPGSTATEGEMPHGGMDATEYAPDLGRTAGVSEGAVATRHHVFVLPGREVSRGRPAAEGLAGEGARVGFDYPTV